MENQGSITTLLSNPQQKPLLIAVEGPVGFGKSTFVGMLLKRLTEEYKLKCRVLSTDSGNSSFIGKKHYDYTAEPDIDVFIFDSTGAGQDYPEGTRVFRAGFQDMGPDQLAMTVLVSVWFAGQRGMEHPNILGCNLTVDQIKSLLNGEFVYSGVNKLSFVELLNTESLYYVRQLMNDAGYVINETVKDGELVGLHLKYKDKKQGLHNSLGCLKMVEDVSLSKTEIKSGLNSSSVCRRRKTMSRVDIKLLNHQQTFMEMMNKTIFSNYLEVSSMSLYSRKWMAFVSVLLLSRQIW